MSDVPETEQPAADQELAAMGVPSSCERCGGRMEYSGEHRLGGSMFTCRDCGTTITP